MIAPLPGFASVADRAAYTQALLALVLLSGALLVILSWIRQGQLAAFVSRPVLRSFAFALAITIVIKQLPDALGLAVPADAASDPLHLLAFAAGHAADWHAASMAVAGAAAAVLVVLRRLGVMPAAMLVVVLAIGASLALDLPMQGVATVGVIAPPDWHLAVPRLSMPDWIQIGELAFGLVIIVFAESWGSMRSLALLHGDELDANRELFALGACNIASALLQGMPVGAGFSATSANAASGAKTRWAALAAWVVIVGVMAFALPLVAQLPRPVLAVAVVNALWHALNPAPLVAVWRMNRDRLLMVAAVLAVLFLGVLHGMLVAIAMSILGAVKRFSEPVLHELGRLGTSRNFIAIAAQSQAQPVAGLLILRPEEPLFFASSERVATEVLRHAKSRTDVRTVILSLEETADLDSTALECLNELDRHLRNAGKRLLLSRVKEPVRELLQRWCPEELGHPNRLYWSVADAVDHASETGIGSPHGGDAVDQGPSRSMS